MIHRVYSDLPGFKNLTFRAGLNVLLADESKGATERHTRNGAGKSSLLEIIHFLLGAKCDKDSMFRKPELRDAVFGMEFDLGGAVASIERNGAKPSPVTVAGESSTWPIAPNKKGALTNNHWRTVLGSLMFGIDDVEGAWGPSFRSMISYFMRRESAGGMAEPMKSSAMQHIADQQVNVSFLIGLDWSLPREWQQVRDREKTLVELKRALRQGGLGSPVGGASQLKSELIVAQDRVRRIREAVTSFKVIEQYDELEREASQLTSLLASLADENVLDRRYIAELEASSIEAVAPAAGDLEALFDQAGVILPDLVKRRFDEAQVFHESIVRNRRLYLESELTAAYKRIEDREAEQRRHDTRRSEVMKVLESAGALEQFVALQSELTKAEAAAEAIRQRHATAEALESGQVKLKIERATLFERLRREYAELEGVIQEAVLAFREISAQLYEPDKAGTLTITPTENGPLFEAHIPAERSKGVNNMRIFCFDMMLMLLSLRRGRSPGFLIHDSHLFDGVDERQVASALTIGARLAAEHGFQYLVTMNSDAMPRRLQRELLDAHVLDVKLTDATDDGGLFGLRFE